VARKRAVGVFQHPGVRRATGELAAANHPFPTGKLGSRVAE
jgi:hypothetical protein